MDLLHYNHELPKINKAAAGFGSGYEAGLNCR